MWQEKHVSTLRRFVGKRLKQSGQAILKGENGLAPYKTETERPVITARTMQSAVLIRKRRAMVSGASLYEPEEVWQEIEERVA